MPFQKLSQKYIKSVIALNFVYHFCLFLSTLPQKSRSLVIFGNAVGDLNFQS